MSVLVARALPAYYRAHLMVEGETTETIGPAGTRPEWEVLSAGGCSWMCQLGHGQYGTVHLVTRECVVDDDSHAVAKVVFLDHLKDKDRALALQEVEVLRRLEHPHIVRHYSSWLHRSNQEQAGGGKQEALVTLMEYCAGGDLRQYLDEYAKRQEYMEERLVLALFVQMLEAMRYVHSHKVLHRDLKSSNMLLTADRQTVKIGDFGIARVLDNTAAVAVTMLGTPYYMSPEVCKGEPYREKSDVWSLGCVLYEMCVLRHAFESQSLLGLVYCIVSECYQPIPAERYSSDVADLVAQLLLKAADQRPSVDEALGLDVLRAYRAGEVPVPPPPPPPQRHDDAPLPPPSPGRSSASGLEEEPLLGVSLAMPALRRPAPPSPRRRESPSPRRSRLAAAWTEIGPEAQVILARARGALLRRPKSNWVLAFARHDTTGEGALSPPRFGAFLASLDLGLSAEEVERVAERLAAAAQGAVSLGCFSEAITNAAPTEELWGEAAALRLARALPLREDLEERLCAPEGERLRAWLPKRRDGDIDWAQAEQWRR